MIYNELVLGELDFSCDFVYVKEKGRERKSSVDYLCFYVNYDECQKLDFLSKIVRCMEGVFRFRSIREQLFVLLFYKDSFKNKDEVYFEVRFYSQIFVI